MERQVKSNKAELMRGVTKNTQEILSIKRSEMEKYEARKASAKTRRVRAQIADHIEEHYRSALKSIEEAANTGKYEKAISLKYCNINDEHLGVLADSLVERLQVDSFEARKRMHHYECGNHGYGSDQGVWGCSCSSYWVIDVKW